MRLWRAILLAGGLLGAPVAALAQEPAPNAPLPAATFRILDQDELFRGSRLGQQILAEIRAAEAALEAENQALVDQLAAEERALTEARASLPPDEFRARADAFDARVEAIRQERAERSRALNAESEAMAQRFFDSALPVLVQMMADTGVQALLKPDVMILGPDWLDITPEAIARLDAALAPPGPAEE